ncbi:hypothetical protein VRL91_000849 [Salmonella enterica]|nr:hypothetical protein [Salmonella enterica]EMD5502252.1 hypothetical protein [Salmonella enterica]
MKTIAKIIIAIHITLVIGVLTGLVIDNSLISNHPEGYLFTSICIISFGIYLLQKHRASYKILNDLILALSAGIIASEYLFFGNKQFDIIPVLSLKDSDPQTYYLMISKFIVVTCCLTAKVFITLKEFLSLRKNEKLSGKYPSAIRNFFSFIRKIFPAKIKNKVQNKHHDT